MAAESHTSPDADQRAFLTTRWSIVLRAGTNEGHDELAQLCRDYWYPLYAYLRRRGLTTHDAQDVAQGFFLHVIGDDLLTKADAAKGRFRSFLLTSLQYFLSKEVRAKQAMKRGGGETVLSIDSMEAEHRFALEPADAMTPETQFERSWAFALIERVGGQLSADYERAGRAELFAKLQPFLSSGARQAGHAEVGRELAMTENAVAVAIHRMRRRFGELLRAEIAHTVSSPEDVEEEIAYLLAVVARG